MSEPITKQAQRITELLRPFGFPTPPGRGLGFTRADDDLLERGWPHLRLVTDELVMDSDAQAEEALEALDPLLPLRVPRLVAEAFLRGYLIGPNIHSSRLTTTQREPLLAERRRALTNREPVTLELLEATLQRLFSGQLSDTYGWWRLPELLYLYEALIGTDEVATLVTAQLTGLAEPGESLGSKDGLNHPGHTLTLTLPWLLRRASPALTAELRARLARAAPAAWAQGGLAQLRTLLQSLAQTPAPLPTELQELGHELAYINEDIDYVAQRVARLPKTALSESRSLWLLGGAPLAGRLSIPEFPPAVRILDELGILRDPGIVRVVALLASRRTAATAVSEWLRAHEAHARPILDTLLNSGLAREAKAATSALKLLARDPPRARATSQQELAAELARIFGALSEALKATLDRDAQIELIQEAFEAYTEANAAALESSPAAYFTHRMSDFGLGEWAMLAADAIS